jgi:TrmH family RNA methyltransferase
MLSKSRIKYIQSLYHKKFRDELGAFIVEGPKIVSEFLQQVPSQVESIYATGHWLRQEQALLRLLPTAGIEEINEDELHRISHLASPHQVLAVVRKWNYGDGPATQNSITLMLEGIRDPGNMGTLIRIADCFGIKNIICSDDCVELYNPKVVQSTMGSMLRVNLWYRDLIEWLTTNTNNNLPLWAATMNGKSIYECGTLKEGIVLIGNESTGITESLLEMAALQITIPSRGNAESLNAAVAAGIILSHVMPY